MMQPQRWWLSETNGWGSTLVGEGGVRSAVDLRGLRRTRRGLVLNVRPDGLLDPLRMPATVGSTTLPPPVAVTGQDVFLAVPGGIIKQYDRSSSVMVDRFDLERITRQQGNDRLALDVCGRLLLGSTRGRRVLVAVHRDAGITYDRRVLPPDKRIIDARAADSGLFVLVSCHAQQPPLFEVWFWRPGRPVLHRCAVIAGEVSTGLRHGRILTGKHGELYVFDPHRANSDTGEPESSVAELEDLRKHPEIAWKPFDAVRDDLSPMPLPVERNSNAPGWRIRVPPAGHVWTPGSTVPAKWPAFDAHGRSLIIQPDEPSAPPPYLGEGIAEFGPLDGGANRVGWDRVLVDLTDLPVGGSIEISTRTHDEPEESPYPEREWSLPHRHIGPLKPDTDTSSASTASKTAMRPGHPLPSPNGTPQPSLPDGDFAVLSGPGRYLWLRVRVLGGSVTPVLRAITISYPRRGLVDYLPAVYREADRESRFLERFLAALEAVWEPIERSVTDIDRELLPETARPSMVAYLAEWFAEPLAEEWGVTERRRAVRAAVERRPMRGTPGALQQALRVFLANRWSVAPETLGNGVPFVWEHFRSRNFVRMPVEEEGTIRPGSLFGSEILRRLRVGRTRIGEGVLRDFPPAAQSSADPVYLDAHRYSVFVPASLLPTEHDVRGLQAVMQREAPAHAIGCIEAVQPRLILGRQATLGVDTVVGAYPRARLAEAGESPDSGYYLNFDALIAEGDAESWTPRPTIGSHDSYLPWELA